MCNMEAHDYVILLTCGLRRPGVSRERRSSNLDWEVFSYLVTFSFLLNICFRIPSNTTSIFVLLYYPMQPVTLLVSSSLHPLSS